MIDRLVLSLIVAGFAVVAWPAGGPWCLIFAPAAITYLDLSYFGSWPEWVGNGGALVVQFVVTWGLLEAFAFLWRLGDRHAPPADRTADHEERVRDFTESE